ncbi:GNAT family N-acetyltransferase [Alkalihalobacillus sp. AL-G]|uniref:GNAT family N-acetyltransferase n=1 Tax=Alkalihalobacillus sp. AL-G TaxID=2926399 RepID=UPI00272C3288|nr:GNAT family N-acetyltransferase [Alkalihalobacillus sp. AL-G]WLD94701.1 GNAT family N-acetyltransferase [Alkalihalobacillus sp. AL-G]
MPWKISTTEELTKTELITIFQERVKVFVVEQDCPYQEIDDYDLNPNVFHIFKMEENELLAYARVIDKQDYIKFGRVLVNKNHRGKRLGNELLQKVMEFIEAEYHPQVIKIEAQAHLEHYYAAFGLRQNSDVFLEDGIPHIEMVWIRQK